MAIRIGFVGTGGIAQVHFDALSQIDAAQLVAFCDVESERAQRAAERFGGRAYTDWRVMLDREALDALYICVPPYAHDGVEEAAAERGIHLFVEKPVARTVEQAKRIEAAIQKAGILSMVGYHFRYYGAIERAKERLQGLPVLMVKGAWDGGMPGVAWWRKHELSGGQLVEQTTHIFDLARYLVGEITEVFTYSLNRPDLLHYPDGDVNVSDVVCLRFENGAVGVITNTNGLHAPGEVGLKVYTPERIIEVSWGRMVEVEPNRKEEFFSRDNPYVRESQAFLEAIRTGNRDLIRADYSEGVKTLAVTLAADESGRTGKPIRVSVS
ncbi:MAG: Gfo/Idh/MocA family oxidoreductase [Armatimonadota bacterium]|nr:Gfo/Idh/MocA family oxidoreductase [Armatimonadota bacterium]